MGSLGVASNRFMDHASKTVSIIVIVSYHVVLHLDLPCSCKPGMNQCNVYMVVPFFIIFFVILWTDISCQTTLRYTCKNFRCKFCCVLLKNTLKAVCIGLLWVVSVLIDGDWFVCCENDQSPKQIVLACKVKNKSNLTSEEQEIITELKGKSLWWGLSIILVICSLGAFGSGIYSCLSSCSKCCQKLKECCQNPKKCCKNPCECCHTQHEIEELILEECENQLKDRVIKATGLMLTSRLPKDWEEEVEKKSEEKLKNKKSQNRKSQNRKMEKCFAIVDETVKDIYVLLNDQMEMTESKPAEGPAADRGEPQSEGESVPLLPKR
ncbi:uncharacterized protein LOC115361783 isoform X3 [Myripristis murdjan]|uniref:uncharacterized protein LOC115361783 isoform X3 n=1 Tax=Myripristis murdjan TaxID=586833 RepID=UPI0011762B9E|nr:uncharacterized protein LOC115361783 isoform X3 [Myripristis murdjan]